MPLKARIVHQAYDCLRIIGLRDRLRCPACRSVGTFKPHGGWFDRSDYRVRRWMCKWCGWYVGPERECMAVPDPVSKVWVLRSTCPEGRTPAMVVREHSPLSKVWPWQG